MKLSQIHDSNSRTFEIHGFMRMWYATANYSSMEIFWEDSDWNFA